MAWLEPILSFIFVIVSVSETYKIASNPGHKGKEMRRLSLRMLNRLDNPVAHKMDKPQT